MKRYIKMYSIYILFLLSAWLFFVQSMCYAHSNHLIKSTLRVPIGQAQYDQRMVQLLYRVPSASEFGIKTIVFDYGNIFRTFDYAKVAHEVYVRYGIEEKNVIGYFENRESDQNHWMFKYDKGLITKSQAAEKFQNWIRENSKYKQLTLKEEEFDNLLWLCWNQPAQEVYYMLRTVVEKGYNVKIVTTTNPTHYSYTVKDLVHLLPNGEKDIYASFKQGFDKRAQDIYERVVREEGGRPDQYLFIDDVQHNLDVAAQSGMQVSLFSPANVEESINSTVNILEQNFDSFLKGFKIKKVRDYLTELACYMYGAYGVQRDDVIRMLDIIAGAKGSRYAIENVYAAGMKWNDPNNKYGAKYKAYKTSTQPDIRSELVRGLVKSEEDKKIVVFDIGTGNMSMLAKVIGPLQEVTSAAGADIVTNEQLDRIKSEIAKKDKRLRFEPQVRPDKLPEGIKDHSVDVVTIIGVLHHMTDRVIISILQEVHRILKEDGKLVVLEDTSSDAKPLNFSEAYQEEARIELSREFNRLTREQQNYIFAIVDWMGNHLAQHITGIPLSFNFKTEKEWSKIFFEAGFEVKKEVYPGITPYKFHTHPELIFMLKPNKETGVISSESRSCL